MKTKVKLNGGPKGGEWINYSTPLPKVIVMTEVTKSGLFHYDDYERRGDTEQYDFIRRSRSENERT